MGFKSKQKTAAKQNVLPHVVERVSCKYVIGANWLMALRGGYTACRRKQKHTYSPGLYQNIGFPLGLLISASSSFVLALGFYLFLPKFMIVFYQCWEIESVDTWFMYCKIAFGSICKLMVPDTIISVLKCILRISLVCVLRFTTRDSCTLIIETINVYISLYGDELRNFSGLMSMLVYNWLYLSTVKTTMCFPVFFLWKTFI